MSIALTFDAVSEDAPGPLWAATFARHWPSYRAWYLRNAAELPSYLECRRALREHMPELVPVWERLTELAGGGDVESRFLSMWCPPLYVVGCSQGVWLDRSGVDEPALLRNYDFAPALLEGNWLATRWTGPRVVAVADCGWGVLDGINEAGLVASLSFGGRSALGAGFGVPVVMRYLLEVAQTVPQAVKHLQRLPASMSYNITLLDARGEYATVYIAPDRACEVTRDVAVTNFQRQIDGPNTRRRRWRRNGWPACASGWPPARRSPTWRARCSRRRCTRRSTGAGSAPCTARLTDRAAGLPSCSGPASAGSRAWPRSRPAAGRSSWRRTPRRPMRTTLRCCAR